MMNHNTIYHYVDLRGDLLACDVPYNEIDALIFSELAYVDFDWLFPTHEPITLQTALQKYRHHHAQNSDEPPFLPSYHLFEKMADSPRYQNIQILAYVNEIDQELIKQFAAMALLLEDGRIVIAYRGTDDSLIGWHEDFLMLCEKVVPAQVSSVQFLEKTAALNHSRSLWQDLKNPFLGSSILQRLKTHIRYQKNRPLWLVGHSKGGNLAMYAGCFCSLKTQQRIIHIDNFDGPGFQDEIITSPQYKKMLPLIHSYIPHYSFFGIVLGHEEDYTVVASQQIGMLQHNAFSWEVNAHHFKQDELSYESVQFAIRVILFLEKLTYKEKHQFVQAMFGLFNSLGLYTFSDLSHISYKHIINAIKELTLLDTKTRKMLLEVLQMLWLEAKKIKK